MTDQVYLDYNATAPLRPEAREAVLAALDRVGNPSSVHGYGRRARDLLETARENVAQLAGVASRLVTFTSGGTEANHLAFHGTNCQRYIACAVEHPSVLKARDAVDIVRVDEHGIIDLGSLDRMLTDVEGRALVSVMAANNETGVVQPIAAVAEIVRRHGAILHVDAVQAVGKLPLDGLDADLMTLSGHKIGGPPGAGALIRKSDLPVTASQRGGGQELGLRSGTESLPAIAGFGAAARACQSDDLQAWRRRRDKIETETFRSVPGTVVLANDAERLANTTCVAMPGVSAETLVMTFDLQGVAISAGSACSSGKVTASHVLIAMGRADIADQAIRVSHGWATTDRDIDRFLSVWVDVDKRLGSGRNAA